LPEILDDTPEAAPRAPAPLTASEARKREWDDGWTEGRRGNWNALGDWYDRYEPP
jgi:hypothetical protein